ncbi:MAG: Ldh family oxidoreductase [Amphritea sp.]
MTTRTLSLAQIEELSYQALTGAGTSDTAARSLARAVAAAERDGIKSHGLVYVPNYCEHVRCGKVIGQAVPQLSTPSTSAVVVDAGSGFAHPAIDKGFEKLVELAKENGCAGLAINNSYNCGVLGYHTERLAEQGLLALGFTNAPASIAPIGGNKPVVGTNPFSMATPDGKGGVAFVLDQSASVVAKSEIMMHSRAGKAIPVGWALDAEGNPTTDPDVGLKGSMAPSGGYKGFGVGLMVEVLSAALSGATLGTQASPFSGTAGGPPKTGQFFFAIDPQTFSGETFAERISDLVASIEEQPDARLPGQRRNNNRAGNDANGVEISEELLAKVEAYIG